MRLIDADKRFNWGKYKLSDAGKYGNKDGEQQSFSYSKMMMYEIADEIEEAPTVDAAPGTHGEWVWFEEWSKSTTDGTAECQSAGYKCSHCGVVLSDYINEACGEITYIDDFEKPPTIAYCPNCGAKMDKEVNHDKV